MKKGRHDKHSSYVGLERRLLFRCEEWRILSMRAKIAYVHLKAHYNGANNGDIRLSFSEMKMMPGFRSPAGFYSAMGELIRDGWILRTSPGGLYRNPNTYKLTGKFDAMV